MLFVLFASLATAIVARPLHEHLNTVQVDHFGREMFGKPRESTGRLVETWNENMGVNPEEMGEYLEGDILFPTRTKNGLLATTARWKDGVVPYEIKGSYDKSDLGVIFAAMDQYHKNTCIRFRRRKSGDDDYLLIANTKTGCWSSVGRVGGDQTVNLQSPGCLSTLGTPVHEFMHALGFHHEQTRFERDDYVDILWDNIQSGKEGNFAKVKNGTTTAYGVDYDYGSVMHYSGYAFSKNKKPTIVTKKTDVKIGQRNGFSQGDLIKVRMMYNCADVDENSQTIEVPSYTTVAPDVIDSVGDLLNVIFG